MKLRWFSLLICLLLICSIAGAQVQYRIAAWSGSGFSFANIDGNGNLMTASGSATPVPVQGYVPAVALAALNTTTGQFQFLHIDSNGNLLTSGSGGSSSGPIAGATADFNFLDGSGTTLTDATINKNNGTLGSGGQAPTWVNGGLAFNIANNVSLPAALNNTKSFYFAFYVNPLPTSNAAVVAQPFPLLLSSTLGVNGINIMTDDRRDQGTTPGFAPCVAANGNYSSCSALLVSGFNILTVTMGSTDKYYINGNLIPLFQSGSSFGAQSSGNFLFGTSNTSIFTASGFNGTFYRAVFMPTEDSASTVQATYQKILTDINSRSIPTFPVPVIQTGPTIYAAGDSITFGLGLTTPATQSWPANLSLTNQPAYSITNMGLTGMTLSSIVGSEPNRIGTLCQSQQGPAIGIIFAGTNDAASSQPAAKVMGGIASWVQIVKNAGCKAFVGTMISRSGGLDAFKDTYDALILTSAKSVGADGVIDFAANPLVGADGANTNVTYFQADNTHPTAAGQLLLAAAASNTLNYYFGFNAANPHAITASTYQMTAGDGYVAVTPATTTALTLPDCTGQSGALYTVSNLSTSSVTVVTGSSSQLINGLSAATTVAIPSNSSVVFRDVANAKTVAGCHWEK